jgi:hypothetical protein
MRRFKTEVSRVEGDVEPLPRDVQEKIAAHLRGAVTEEPGKLAEYIRQSVGFAEPLAVLILKTAVVQQETRQSGGQPIGTEVVGCLRSILDVLRQGPEGDTKEGWAELARTLAALEESVLSRLNEIAAGTDEDAEIIRDGVRSLQHALHGASLRHEYQEKRKALAQIERRIREFFDIGDSDAIPGIDQD